MIWAGLALLLLLTLAALLWYLAEQSRSPMDDTARAHAPGRFAELSRGVTHYRWDGPKGGPVAVCIHGLTTGCYVWEALVKVLTQMGFRVLRYDLYGRGLSARPGGRQDLAFFRQQLHELLADQKVDETVTLVGYSMGGSIAMDFAAAEPARVDHLVLLAPTGLGYVPPGFLRVARDVPVVGDWMMQVFGGAVLRRQARGAARVSSCVDKVYERQMTETRARGYLNAVLSSLRHALNHDTTAEHRHVAGESIPVLAVWGGRDAVIPRSAPGRLAQVSRAARQVTVEDAGHGLPHTHPREIHAALQEFLREL